MEKIGKVSPVLRKERKKQVKNDLDHLKQAEKKKRRLEKALATSAAIRSELEKKKQKKKEEQQRLDEEGAATAEAVALHVLGEDSDDSWQILLKNNRRFNPWDHSGNVGLFMDYQSYKTYPFDGLGCVYDAYGSRCTYNNEGIEWSAAPGMVERDLQMPYFEEPGQRAEISAGLIAAQAVSSLQIAEDSLEGPYINDGETTLVVSRMLGSCGLGSGANLYKDF